MSSGSPERAVLTADRVRKALQDWERRWEERARMAGCPERWSRVRREGGFHAREIRPAILGSSSLGLFASFERPDGDGQVCVLSVEETDPSRTLPPWRLRLVAARSSMALECASDVGDAKCIPLPCGPRRWTQVALVLRKGWFWMDSATIEVDCGAGVATFEDAVPYPRSAGPSVGVHACLLGDEAHAASPTEGHGAGGAILWVDPSFQGGTPQGSFLQRCRAVVTGAYGDMPPTACAVLPPLPGTASPEWRIGWGLALGDPLPEDGPCIVRFPSMGPPGTAPSSSPQAHTPAVPTGPRVAVAAAAASDSALDELIRGRGSPADAVAVAALCDAGASLLRAGTNAQAPSVSEGTAATAAAAAALAFAADAPPSPDCSEEARIETCCAAQRALQQACEALAWGQRRSVTTARRASAAAAASAAGAVLCRWSQPSDPLMLRPAPAAATATWPLRGAAWEALLPGCVPHLIASAGGGGDGAKADHGLERREDALSRHCLLSGTAGAAAALAWATGTAAAATRLPSHPPAPASELSAAVDLALRPLALSLCALAGGVTSTWRPLSPSLAHAVAMQAEALVALALTDPALRTASSSPAVTPDQPTAAESHTGEHGPARPITAALMHGAASLLCAWSAHAGAAVAAAAAAALAHGSMPWLAVQAARMGRQRQRTAAEHGALAASSAPSAAAALRLSAALWSRLAAFGPSVVPSSARSRQPGAWHVSEALTGVPRAAVEVLSSSCFPAVSEGPADSGLAAAATDAAAAMRQVLDAVATSEEEEEEAGLLVRCAVLACTTGHGSGTESEGDSSPPARVAHPGPCLELLRQLAEGGHGPTHVAAAVEAASASVTRGPGTDAALAAALWPALTAVLSAALQRGDGVTAARAMASTLPRGAGWAWAAPAAAALPADASTASPTLHSWPQALLSFVRDPGSDQPAAMHTAVLVLTAAAPLAEALAHSAGEGEVGAEEEEAASVATAAPQGSHGADPRSPGRLALAGPGHASLPPAARAAAQRSSAQSTAHSRGSSSSDALAAQLVHLLAEASSSSAAAAAASAGNGARVCDGSEGARLAQWLQPVWTLRGAVGALARAAALAASPTVLASALHSGSRGEGEDVAVERTVMALADAAATDVEATAAEAASTMGVTVLWALLTALAGWAATPLAPAPALRRLAACCLAALQHWPAARALPPPESTWAALRRHLASPRVAAFRPGQQGTAAVVAAVASLRAGEEALLLPSARFRRASALVRRAMVADGAVGGDGDGARSVPQPALCPVRPFADWTPWRRVAQMAPFPGPHATAAVAAETHAAAAAALEEAGTQVTVLPAPRFASPAAECTAAALQRVILGTFFTHPRGTARHAAWLLRRGDAAPVTCVVEGDSLVIATCEGHRRWTVPLRHLLWARSVLWLQQPAAVEVAVLEGGQGLGGDEHTPREEALLLMPTPSHATALLRAIAAACGGEVTSPARVAAAATALAKAGRLTWLRWLLAVNVAAGRTFQELSQYPVAPWVLQGSGDARRRRDLARPAAVQSSARAERASARMQALGGAFVPPPDPFTGRSGAGGGQSRGGGGGSAFAHGSLYSSLGTVVFFNVRLPAFASAAQQLQGGKFDHPDRMFWSVPVTWDNCQQSDADAKELVPELFCTPAVLRNESGLALGRRHDGSAIDDVGLPAWAPSPEHFVRANTAALGDAGEALLAWAALVFGASSRGQGAVEAVNTFPPPSYPGFALETVDEISVRAAATHILQFGQVPLQVMPSPGSEPDG